MFGHNALLLERSDGWGEYYSFAGDESKMLELFFGFSTKGYIARELVNMSNFKSKGYIETSYFNGIAITDDYDAYIIMSITDGQGIAMHYAACDLIINTPDYNLYSNSCEHVAQQILAAAGLNFAPTHGYSYDEQATLLYTILGPGNALNVLSQINYNMIDGTIPNGAFAIGSIMSIWKGWTFGLF